MTLLDKLYIGSKQDALFAILELYEKQGYAFIHFLYFANVMHHRLLEGTPKAYQASYLQALLSGDFLLPDGIALQLFYRWGAAERSMLHNLNGTDFIPFFLEKVCMGRRIHIGLFTVYDPILGKPADEMDKAVKYIQQTYEPVGLFADQCAYQERGKVDLEGYEKSLQEHTYDFKILLVCTGTPQQEIWIEEHREFFQEHNVVVFSAGGLVDFFSGYEMRAPSRVVRARVLETFWRIVRNPNKNLKKFFWMFGVVRYRWYLLRRKVSRASE